jgi:hypothetical protein
MEENPYKSPEKRHREKRRRIPILWIVIALWLSLLPILYFGIWLLAAMGGRFGD